MVRTADPEHAESSVWPTHRSNDSTRPTNRGGANVHRLVLCLWIRPATPPSPSDPRAPTVETERPWRDRRTHHRTPATVTPWGHREAETPSAPPPPPFISCTLASTWRSFGGVGGGRPENRRPLEERRLERRKNLHGGTVFLGSVRALVFLRRPPGRPRGRSSSCCSSAGSSAPARTSRKCPASSGGAAWAADSGSTFRSGWSVRSC